MPNTRPCYRMQHAASRHCRTVEREEREKDMGKRWEMLGSMVHTALSTHPHDTLLLLRWPNTSSSSRTIAARYDPHGRR
jgi:hypothetical protein